MTDDADVTQWLMQAGPGDALEVVPQGPAWLARAACVGVDTDVFFATDPTEALAVCAGCPVRVQCDRWADECGFRFGTFGGITESDRNDRRRARDVAA